MTYRWFLLIVFLCTWKTLFCIEIFNYTNEPTNINEVKANIEGLVNSVAEWISPIALRITTESNISMSCNLSFSQYLTDIKKLKGWALKMFDASAKLPSGIFHGNFILFGDYDECLDIRVMNARGKVSFQGQYCMVKLWAPEFIMQHLGELNTIGHDTRLWKIMERFRESPQLHLGLCVPSTCTSQEINQIARIATRAFGLLPEVTCETQTKKEPNTEQIVFLCIFASFALLVIIGTVIDIITQHNSVKMKSGELNKLLIAFSFYSNTVRLFRTVQNDSTLSALRGFRVLTIFWIILAHTYFHPPALYYLKYSRLTALKEFDEDIMYKTIQGASMAVDTFFVLSGLLFVYTIWKKLEENKKSINSVIYICHRIARILPIEMLLIALSMTIPFTGNGPIWDEITKHYFTACKNNWWTNLLFIQNFWPYEQICLPHTWFVAALFQLLMLTFGVIFVLFRWPKFGISIYLLLILSGCLVTGFVMSSYDLPSYYTLKEEKVSVWYKYSDLIHSRPYTHLSSYCIGSLLGYAIVAKRHFKIKPWKQLMLWSVATFGALIVLYGVYFMDRNTKREIKFICEALHRTVWSSCVSWILFACLTGYGGFIGRFLSWKGLIPLDRLTFMAYLLHPFVITYYTARTRASIYLAHVEQVYMFAATIVFTLCFSYISNVTIEQPLMYVESFVLRKFSKTPSPDGILPTIVSPPTNELVESRTGITITSAKPILEQNIASEL